MWDQFIDAAPAGVRERLVGEPQFRDDKDLLPLQAADFRAWHARNAFSKEWLGKPQFPVPLKPDKDLVVLSSVWPRQKIVHYKQELMRYAGSNTLVIKADNDSIVIQHGIATFRIGSIR